MSTIVIIIDVMNFMEMIVMNSGITYGYISVTSLLVISQYNNKMLMEGTKGIIRLYKCIIVQLKVVHLISAGTCTLHL